ncbi:MAG: phenylpyruvate tautomerase MIF-related protein [bacterium]|nr:phenylpyruvate tautomerase MIF-related protein [bacterium]
MPFIDSKITVPVSSEKKESIKAKLGQAIRTLGKTETYLMVGFDDNYDLYLGGDKLEKGAFVSVSLFGNASSSAYDKMTGEICSILSEELGIPGNCVYVTYHGVNDWGWNGANF